MCSQVDKFRSLWVGIRLRPSGGGEGFDAGLGVFGGGVDLDVYVEGGRFGGPFVEHVGSLDRGEGFEDVEVGDR